MKKLIIAAAAAAALTGMGGAFAQSAECAPGITGHSPMPGCHPNTATPDYGPPKVLGYGDYPLSQVLPLMLSDGRWVLPQQILQQQAVPMYQPSRRDRDGDGVRNRDDRYPDDPRFR